MKTVMLVFGTRPEVLVVCRYGYIMDETSHLLDDKTFIDQ